MLLAKIIHGWGAKWFHWHLFSVLFKEWNDYGCNVAQDREQRNNVESHISFVRFTLNVLWHFSLARVNHKVVLAGKHQSCSLADDTKSCNHWNLLQSLVNCLSYFHLATILPDIFNHSLMWDRLWLKKLKQLYFCSSYGLVAKLPKGSLAEKDIPKSCIH